MNGRRVMVVEDDRDVREFLAELLMGHGYEVEALADGRRLISGMRARRPDLVLLDVGLPDADGFTLCREIRGTAELEAVPVMFLSARTSSVDRAHGLRVGADDYVAKPFDLEDLMRRIARVLLQYAH